MGGDVGTPADGGRGVRVPPGIISQADVPQLGAHLRAVDSPAFSRSLPVPPRGIF